MKEQNPFLAPTNCQCEQSRCAHGEHECREQAVHNVATIYGVFKMCDTCANNLPKEFKKPTSSEMEAEYDRAAKGGLL